MDKHGVTLSIIAQHSLNQNEFNHKDTKYFLCLFFLICAICVLFLVAALPCCGEMLLLIYMQIVSHCQLFYVNLCL